MSFYQHIQGAEKIAIVELGFLGDSIHLLPALWNIKEVIPKAAIHVVAAPLGGELLRMSRAADQVWAFPLTTKSPPWWRHWSLLCSLRREKFDAAITFSGADRALLMTRFIGGKRRLAHEGGRRHFWTRGLFHDVVPRQSRTLPVFQQRLEVLRAAGFPATGAPRFDLDVPVEARDWVVREFGAKPFIHCSLNASHPLKEWPLSRWIEFAKLWRNRFPDVTLVASGGPGKREGERLRSFEMAVNGDGIRVCPQLTLVQLAALVAKSSVHLGADSGVLHLAMALGKPTVSFFRDYAGLEEWSPVGERHRVFVQRCRCADVDQPPCAAFAEARCLGEITPEIVMEAVAERLKR
jgi:ADP-heptose:LPS heptosyltransferase